MKLTNMVKYAKLPLREDRVIMLWELHSVDLCGPWMIKCEFEETKADSPNQIKTAQKWALIMIDEGSS